MTFIDTLKSAMKGRSATIERAIDTAVERLGRYSVTLSKQAEGVKARARRLDSDRAPDGSDTSPPTMSVVPGATDHSTEAHTSGLKGSLAPPSPSTVERTAAGEPPTPRA